MPCPQCAENDLLMLVDITISCPAGQQALNKTALRSKMVQILAANWEKARYYCKNCGYNFNFEKD